MYKIIVDYNPLDSDKQKIRNGIVSFNEQAMNSQAESFSLFLKSSDDIIQGGILAWLHPESIYIDVLWIEQNSRSQGYGSELLKVAEQEGIKYGCLYSTLDTFSFQAEEFYLKNGYQRIGEIPNYLFEHSRIFLRKKLVP